jgi:hypothetical protein
MDALGHSPFVLRTPAMPAALAGIALTALITREPGGGAIGRPRCGSGT